ncbi:hypothetical protein JOC77_001169 [Peribacillus deserti]|uniref:Uncharacterized protein n=1 Tax=Peribacillus deserti TaxID=673318 RepID=A0ABS2QF34_9BACI|nr:hypothetical protein [Peribacillus deserti]MBM7691762.1 hypothetical protein [Peribacillus deserti]
MAANNLELLVKVKKSLEEQLQAFEKCENEYNFKIAELKQQYELLNNTDSVSNKEKLLELISNTIQYEEAQFKKFLAHKRNHEGSLNHNLYLVCKSLAALLSKHPYRHLCIS